jgi:peptidoglycan/xylan/chitin deacetylase (PgdA/CDA1 family)
LAATVALSFDDGPNPDVTPRILELLARHGVPATFFVWGERAQRFPQLLRLILDGGHSLQPHCFEHVSHWTRDRAEIAADIDLTISLLSDIGAPQARLWRPPYGHTLAGVTAAIAAQRSLELAGWTINPHDYEGHSAADMLAGVHSQLGRRDYDVVLLHDGHRESGVPNRRLDAANTVELVTALLAEEELTFARLDAGLGDSLQDGPPSGL